MTTNTDQTQELTDKINESITALCAETDAAKQNETYRAWLDTLSRFYSYSFNNWLLIYTQRPDATRVAGFRTWKSLGRFVKKGEHGIRILAPIIRRVEEEKNGAAEQVPRPVGLRSIAVFALGRQTANLCRRSTRTPLKEAKSSCRDSKRRPLRWVSSLSTRPSPEPPRD